MTRIFNPPPTWPQPPRNWSPPPDWQPDPAWGPPPPGWQLWIDDSLPTAPPGQPKEQRIFISYRRGDCQPQANAINDGLRHRIQPAHIFMDIDSIPPGVDFEQHIRDEINICDVVLVLIGDDWLSSTSYEGTRRIDEPDDFVRLEIESALESPRVSVVPVLVEGAPMPHPAELPESLRPLARINAIELSDQRWTSDIERLADVIRELEAQQEARAERRPGTSTNLAVEAQPSPAVYVPPAVPRHFAAPTPTGPPEWVGWVMVAVPLVSCGMLSFVPSIWVAVQRRSSRRAMVTSLVIAGAFFALVVAAFVLIGSAPEDEAGVATGTEARVAGGLLVAGAAAAAVLAIFQREPTKALKQA